MMVPCRTWMLTCVATVVVLSKASTTRVERNLVSTQRQLEEAAVKVHVEVHSKGENRQPSHQDALPAKSYSSKQHKRENKSITTEHSETVRNYRHGFVRIESKGAKTGKKAGKGHRQEKSAKQEWTDEAVVKYERGSVKFSGEDPPYRENRNKKSITQNEKEVTGAVNQSVTKLSSMDTFEEKSFIQALGPVGVICGIIGGLGAIIGVVGFAIRRFQSKTNVQESGSNASGLDTDVEVDTRSADELEDVSEDSDDFKVKSLKAADIKSEESTIASDTALGSV